MGKFEYISILRISSMLLIIMFHSLCFYSDTWWLFHTDTIPLWKITALPTVKVGLSVFFLISGFLFGFLYIEKGRYQIISAFILNKARRIMLPYLIWSAFMVAFFSFTPWTDILIGTSHLWFLLTLFELFIVIIALSKLCICNTNTYIDFIITVLSFIVLYAWQGLNHHYILSIENTLYYLPTFIIGFYCAKYQLHHSSKKKTSAIAFIISITILFVLSYLSTIESNTPIEIDLAIRITSCIAAVSALVMTNKIEIPNKYTSIINNLDHNSMGIYIFNQIVVFVVLLIPFCQQFLAIHYLIGPFIIFFVSFLIPWGLAVLFNKTKYFTWMIGS